MKLTRSGTAVGLVLAAALSLAACGSDDNGTVSGAPAGDCASGSITAAGSSAQKNAVDEWIKAYQGRCSGATINYQPVGSGAGIQQFIAGTVDFAGSDSALKDDERSAADARCKTGKAIDLPMVTGPIAVAYNLPGVESLVLDAPTIAKIFSGKVTTWNDPAITALNDGVKLPATKIQAVPPLGRVGDDGQPAEVPHRRSPQRLDVRQGQEVRRSGRPERQGLRRRHAGRQEHRGSGHLHRAVLRRQRQARRCQARHRCERAGRADDARARPRPSRPPPSPARATTSR